MCIAIIKENGIFESHIVGGSKDLQGGQYVDRIGVAYGLAISCR
ncbi:MAG: hypothetical protein ACLUPK_03245 [Veillonella sp.]